jgi:2-polyprenyl-3-methyl-5-hydroxy-6-metoxy-1,4-benzoquinol methylase
MNITACHLCGSQKLSKVLDLGYHPLADFFLKPHQVQQMERRYPLSVLLCTECGHGMNSFVVSKEERYQENDYSYDSSNSKISIAHFTDMARDVVERASVKKGELVVDIGSNIGTLLGSFKSLGADIQGVDPAPNIAELAEKNGIPTINDFFGAAACEKILKRGKAKAITITNAFNHVGYLDEFMQSIVSILREDGTFVIELPYFLQLLKKRHFDVVYLEHVSYVSIKPLVQYFKKFNLNITHIEENDYMSGSVRIFAGYGPQSATVLEQIALEEQAGLFDLETWKAFAQKVEDCKINLLRELVEVRSKGGKVVAIGAAAKGNTLLNYCGIDRTLVEFVTDSSPLKIGKYTPGSHLPILSDDAINTEVTHALILAWNIADFLKGKISPKHPKLDFITPHVIE